MGQFRPKIAFIIATKDRPGELRSLMRSLEEQSHKPDEVILVDGGNLPVIESLHHSLKFPVIYLKSRPPSAARQRNAGFKAVSPETDLIGFLDDDVILEKTALERMMTFWEKATPEVVGAGFSMINHPQLAAAKMKSSPLAESLGLYGAKKGRVLRSGFQTMIGEVNKTMEVQWLPTGAAVWRRPIFELYQFDEWFSAYSYLEDLDFSYRAGKSGRLAVVSDARYFHMMAPAGREDSYAFGQREILNRLYFVRKHPELSTPRCVLALILRMAMSFFLYVKKGDKRFLQRLLGNIAGFRGALFQGMTIFSH
jgi:GT2 family glycosyltransferase